MQLSSQVFYNWMFFCLSLSLQSHHSHVDVEPNTSEHFRPQRRTPTGGADRWGGIEWIRPLVLHPSFRVSVCWLPFKTMEQRGLSCCPFWATILTFPACNVTTVLCLSVTLRITFLFFFVLRKCSSPTLTLPWVFPIACVFYFL